MHGMFRHILEGVVGGKAPDDVEVVSMEVTFGGGRNEFSVQLDAKAADSFARLFDDTKARVALKGEIADLKRVLEERAPRVGTPVPRHMSSQERDRLLTEKRRAEESAAELKTKLIREKQRTRSLRGALAYEKQRMERVRDYNGHTKVKAMSLSLAQLGYPKPRSRDFASHVLDTVATLSAQLKDRQFKIDTLHRELGKAKEATRAASADAGFPDAVVSAITTIKTVAAITKLVPPLKPLYELAQGAVSALIADPETAEMPMRNVEVVAHVAIGQDIERAFEARYGAALKDALEFRDRRDEQIGELVETIERLGWVTPARDVEKQANENTRLQKLAHELSWTGVSDMGQ